MTSVPFEYDDGGRAAAGFVGTTGDCVTRAIAIAGQLPYRLVYDGLSAEQARLGKPRSARDGVLRKAYDRWLDDHGWTWTATMQIGSGCTVHLHPDELPAGRLVARVSKHMVAMVDGVIRDTGSDVDRDGTRCVYGYWTPMHRYLAICDLAQCSADSFYDRPEELAARWTRHTGYPLDPAEVLAAQHEFNRPSSAPSVARVSL